MILASRAASRVTPTACAALLAILLLALCGCGGDGAATADGTTVRSAGTSPASERPKTPAKPAGGACKRQVGGFLTAMDALRERLVAGLSYEQYAEQVEAVRRSYDRVPVDELELACLAGAGTPGEQAFGKYIEAANSWGECIGESGCDAASVEPILQKQWRVASHFLDQAQAGLQGS